MHFLNVGNLVSTHVHCQINSVPFTLSVILSRYSILSLILLIFFSLAQNLRFYNKSQYSTGVTYSDTIGSSENESIKTLNRLCQTFCKKKLSYVREKFTRKSLFPRYDPGFLRRDGGNKCFYIKIHIQVFFTFVPEFVYKHMETSTS